MKLTFDLNIIDNFWLNEDPLFYKFIKKIEKKESFILKNNVIIQEKIKSLEAPLTNWGKPKLAKYSDTISSLLCYMPFGQFCYIIKFLDSSYPGLSFHYVMEARHREDWEPGRLLLERLKTIKTLSLLGLIFSGMRTGLISSLLDKDEEEEHDD